MLCDAFCVSFRFASYLRSQNSQTSTDSDYFLDLMQRERLHNWLGYYHLVRLLLVWWSVATQNTVLRIRHSNRECAFRPCCPCIWRMMDYLWDWDDRSFWSLFSVGRRVSGCSRTSDDDLPFCGRLGVRRTFKSLSVNQYYSCDFYNFWNMSP